MNPAAKITIGAVAAAATFLFGCITMYWSMTDRLEKEVTDRVKTETRLSRLDERVKQIESSVWILNNNNKE